MLLMLSCSGGEQLRLIIGTSTDGTSEGIYTYTFDSSTAKVVPSSMATIQNPTFMAQSEDGRHIYSVSELDSLSAEVVGFHYDYNTNSLKEHSRQKIYDAYPCHIIAGDDFIATANYGGGSITTLPLDRSGDIDISKLYSISFRDGEGASHLHCLVQRDSTIYATDLGKDMIYQFRRDGLDLRSVAATKTPKGTGPRHLTLSPDGKRAYLIGELSGRVIVYDIDSSGALVESSSAVSDSVGGGGSADIHISSDGKFLYASNRLKSDGISTFSIDSRSGALTKIDYTLTGIHPRNFTLSPDEAYLLVACRDSDVVQIYSRNTETGLLSYMGEEFDIELSRPMFVKFLNAPIEAID